MKSQQVDTVLLLPSARDFLRSNSDQYLKMDFRMLKDAIATQCQFPNEANELNKLKNWIRAERMRSKNLDQLTDVEVKKFSKNQDTKEQAEQIFVDQEDKILSAILTLGEQEKDHFLRLKIKENFLLLLKFLESRNNAPNEDFLPRLLNLCDEIEEPKKQTLLFLRICALHQREVLEVDQDLIEAALVELANGAVDQDGAFGLLKISFQNQIAFNTFPLESLLVFQDRYPLQFKRFFNSLNEKIDPQVLKCIPATCFLFTKPFFFELKNQGKNLHQNMEYSYLPSIIKLLAYSFESDQAIFEDLLKLLKDGCLEIFGKGFDLVVLLDAIIEQEILRNKAFFGSLKNHIKLLQHVFKLIADRKIIAIEDDLIEKLLELDQNSYQQAEQAPRVLGDSSEADKKCQAYLLLFKKKNKLELNEIEKDLQLEDISYLLRHFRIQSLSYTQKAAWLTVDHFFECGFNKISMKFETGAGKTTLGLLFLLYQSFNKVKSFYVNHSADLCFRDYNKIVPIAQQLGLSVSYIVSLEDLANSTNSDIFFVLEPIYYEMTERDDWKMAISNSFLLLDEFDETLFGNGVTRNNLSAFTLSKWFVAVTGSSLQKIHSNILQQGLKTIFLEFPPSELLDGRENQCREQQLFPTRKDQLNHITSICKKQALNTPILVILEKEAHRSFLDIAKNLPIKDLNMLNPEEVEAFLKNSFLKKVNDSYYICLLNESQGRGLDAPTSFDIEANGGIATIIAKTPNSQQEFDQFKGRTKRMQNNGQYFLFLWQKGVKESCDNFLAYHFDSAKNTQFIRLNKLLNQIVLYNEANIFVEKKVDSKDEFNDDEKDEPLQFKDKRREQIEADTEMVVDEIQAKDQQDLEKVAGKEANNLSKKRCKGLENEEIMKDDNIVVLTSHHKGMFCMVCEQPLIDPHICQKKNDQVKEVDKPANQQKNILIEKQKEEQRKEQKKRQVKQENKDMIKDVKTSRTSSRRLNPVDQGYFDNYGSREIHDEMLADKVRCDTYTKAIEAIVKGMTVMDVGAGTGFLSVVAAKAGASRVFAVEYSSISTVAEQAIKDNNCEETILLVKKRMEDVAITDIPKVDIIISEWMGYFLLFENMLPSVIDARKRLLKDDGIMLPAQCNIYIAGVEWIPAERNGVVIKVDRKTFGQAQIMLCNYDMVVTNKCSVSDFNVQDCENPLDGFGKQQFTIKLSRTAKVNAFVGWFDVSLTKEIQLSTAPSEPATHWKQVMLFLNKEIQANADDSIEGTFSMRAGKCNHRSLSIDLTYKISSAKSFLRQQFVLEQ